MKMIHLAAALTVATLFACDKTESKPQGGGASTASTTSTTKAAAKVDDKAVKDVYESRCAACHGTTGKGDGPGAAALNPKPRSFSADKAWHSGTTDEQIKKVIIQGGAAVGKSPIMPASPDLDGKPEVVDGLVKMIRGFGG